MRKSDLKRGSDDRPGTDGRPPEPPDDPGSAARRLAWAVVGAVFFFVLAYGLNLA